ncbi:MAG: GC-type dockerin domain-anchored protein [Planctomycetota bacterium]
MIRDRFSLVSRWCLTSIAMGAHVGLCTAAPVVTPWATDAASSVDAVAAADLSGWYATASTDDDRIEIRDVRQQLKRVITRDDLVAQVPWASLDAGPDGPRALAWTDSGRSLFITVTDSNPAPDGLGSDAVLRYDTASSTLSLFARANIGDAMGDAPALMHHRGQLWVSTQSGPIRVYRAGRNDTAGSFEYSWSLPGGEAARGMAAARSLGLVHVISESGLYRVDLTQPFASGTLVGPVTRGAGLAYSDHYGTQLLDGAFILEAAGEGVDARVRRVPWFQAAGLIAYSPIEYLSSPIDLNAIADTACGGLLLGSDAAEMVRDSDDTRMDYDAWLRDEFDQVVAFAQGLVAPDGEPAGWVIDADVAVGNTRFHPASPDGAAWVVMLMIAQDHLAGDESSSGLVRDVLRRYAGLMPDGITPELTADGIMRHWYSPFTGGVKPGWDPEFATLSNMLIVMASDRARRFYGSDPEIVAAADEIIGRVQNWDAYIQPGSDALYLKAQPFGGPDFGTAGGPFYEGVLFVEQASVYGNSDDEYEAWLDRDALPAAQYAAGSPVTTNIPGEHLPAFVTLYPLIAQAAFRNDPDWRTHTRNLLASNGAWTDDNAPGFMTVFSAGTTRADWGGYNADSLSDNPGDVTTFPSLLGFSSLGETAPSVGAYQAYRLGARQQFASGASILFRRSAEDPSFAPGDAGLSDVVIGALGIAELLSPGLTDAVLAVPYRPECPADVADPSGTLNFFDISAFLSSFIAGEPGADVARPFGQLDFFDISTYLGLFSQGCP